MGFNAYSNDFFNCTYEMTEEIYYHNNNNIFEDPLLDSDYHLQYGSPCIDAGTPNEYDPDGTPTDIGAYYYDHIPDAPYLQTISKDANDHPVLTWTPPGDNDIQKYIVFKQYANSSGTESWTVDVGLATTWTDNGITLTKFGNTTAIYKVKAVDNVDQESAYSNSRAVDGDGPLWKPVSEIPKEFALHQAYPNPFNPSTQISFDIPSETKVLIELYDLLGQKVRTLVQTNCHPGYHSVVWDGKNDNGNPMSAGTYFIKMITGEYQKLTKCTLIK
jgi:hypothetical protein